MHSRYRSPGNGYRSNFTGNDMPNSRIPPEGSTRGRGFYNPEYRSFNRGFGFGRGQGQMKSYQPRLPTPPRSVGGRNRDIFMEAGRLAAEYLVSQGLLPPSALSGKSQNVSEKGFVSQDREGGRKSALSRVGNSSFDDQRRYAEYTTGNRRGDSFHRDSREYGRSSSWSDSRNRASPDMDGVENQLGENLSGKDIGDGVQSSGSGENAPKTEETSYAEVEKSQLSDDLCSKTSFSGGGKNLSHSTDGEISKSSDLEDSSNNEPEKKDIVDDSSIQLCESNSGIDLISLCKFAKIPTKTRSSLTCKTSKADSLLNNDEETNPDCRSQNKTEYLDGLSDKLNKTHDKLEVCERVSVSAPSIDIVEELGSNYGLEQGKWIKSQSFPNNGLTQGTEQQLGQRGEKRAMEESNDPWEGIKKMRNFLQSSGNKAEETIHPVHLSEETEENAFPSSFKICDLNTMESSDMNENQNSNVLLIAKTEKEPPAQVDIDLSISNSNTSGEIIRQISAHKDIEVIDLEDDYVEEEKTINNLEQRAETVFTNLDSFSNNEHNSCPISDVEDHYDGLMITEYLNAFSNIPTAQENDIGLPPHGEDPLADDDAIYMSLGEIPLSFLPAWEHP